MTTETSTGSYPTRENGAKASPGRPSTSLHFAVGEMSGKLDQLLLTLLPQLNDINARLSVVETWQGRMLGGGAVVIFIITALEAVPYVWHQFSR